MLTRRQALEIWLAIPIGMAIPTRRAAAQFQPFRILIEREKSLAELLNLNDCIPGKLTHVSDFSGSSQIGNAMQTIELPFKNNLSEISAVPAGTYSGRVRTRGPLGWRIELNNTNPRKNIQIHPGNVTEDTRGCILVGNRDGSTPCSVEDSRRALRKLKFKYNDSSNSRPIEIRII